MRKRLALELIITHIVYNTGCVVVISTRERDTLGQLDVAVTRHFNLDAVRVKLRSPDRVLEVGDFAFVEPNHFGADEVASYLL